VTAAETIEQAIARLEEQRGAAMVGPWVQGGFAGEFSGPDDFDSLFSEENADLVVTLHRTIDAQLGILRAGLASISPGDDSTEEIEELALDLARAILGETS
jgi:hypothetical protein